MIYLLIIYSGTWFSRPYSFIVHPKGIPIMDHPLNDADRKMEKQEKKYQKCPTERTSRKAYIHLYSLLCCQLWDFLHKIETFHREAKKKKTKVKRYEHTNQLKF